MAEAGGFTKDGRIALPSITLASHFACSILGGSLLAIQVSIVLQSLASFFELSRNRRREYLKLVIISLLILAASGVDAGCDIRDYSLTLLAPGHSHESRGDKVCNIVGDVMLAITVAIGEGIMIWRCFVLWGTRNAIILPSLFLTGSIGCFIAYLISMDDHVAYHKVITASAFLSIACNITVTALIIYRLNSARKAAFVASTDLLSSQVYSRVTSIIIESAAPLAFFGICFAITSIISIHEPDAIQTDRQASQDSVHEVFSWLYYSFCALSPQMVIFRVITGASLRTVREAGDTVDRVPCSIRFAQQQTMEDNEDWSTDGRKGRNGGRFKLAWPGGLFARISLGFAG